MEENRNYTPTNGGKLEYSETKDGTYKRIYGLLNIPEIGGEPNKISTTTLDNIEFETETNGLKPAPKLNFDFNMEDPNINANINIVDNLAKSKKVYYWKITKANGIVHEYRSKVIYSFKEEENDQISGFTMYHAPIEEIETILPVGAE